MDFLSAEYLSALLAIIVIDLVLAGDNAIVIGLAQEDYRKISKRKLLYGELSGQSRLEPSLP